MHVDIDKIGSMKYCNCFRMEGKKDDYKGYSVWGVDILTRQMYIVRADILEDAGLSTSPQVK